VDTVNARIDLFVDWVATAGTQTSGTLWRRVGSPDAGLQYVRGLYGSSLLGEQAYVSDHEAPLDEQVWYTAINNQTPDQMTAGPFTIPSGGNVWIKDPGRPWADLKLDLCATPDKSTAVCPEPTQLWDTFTRTGASTWGSTERRFGATIQPWTNTGGVASDYNVSAGRGTHLVPATGVARRSTVPQPQADVDVRMDIGVSQLALTDSLFAGLTVRTVDGSNMYLSRLEFLTTGTVRFTLRKIVAGVQTELGLWATLLPYAANSMFTVRMLVKGNTLRARIWPAGTAEPTEWALYTVDTSFAAAGALGTRSLSTGATNVNPLALYYNLDASNPTLFTDDIAWVGFQDKVRAADVGLFPVLDRERPADVYARRKDITTSCRFLTRSLAALDAVYELYTAGGPLLFQVPDIYGMDRPYGYKDRYFQPGDLSEAYISEDQRRPLRLWSSPLTAVDQPVGLPQGTDTANWCAVEDQYPTFAALTATGLTWGQVAQGQAVTLPFAGLYDKGTYTDEEA
jgi:hypothetical protein